MSKRTNRLVPRAHGVRRDRNGLTRCRVCGCTETDACLGGCAWVPTEEDLCTVCYDAALALAHFMAESRRPNRAALWQEAERQLIINEVRQTFR
jgi:hypothetical protein